MRPGLDMASTVPWSRIADRGAACRERLVLLGWAAGTWFWVDPTNDVVFVGMIQRMLGHDNHTMLYRSHAAVYGAQVDPGK